VSSTFDLRRVAGLFADDGPLAGRFRVCGDAEVDERGDRLPVVDSTTGLRAIVRLLEAPDPMRASLAIAALQPLCDPMQRVADPLLQGCWDDLVYVVYRKLAGRRLDAFVEEQGGLPFAEFIPIASQLLLPLATLHGRGIAVGGIRAADVVIRNAPRKDRQLKIEDFGVGRAACAIADLEPLPMDDVRSLGQIFARLLSGENDPTPQRWPRAMKGLDPELPPQLVDLVGQMLEPLMYGAPADAIEVVERLLDWVPADLFPVSRDDLMTSLGRAQSSVSMSVVGPQPWFPSSSALSSTLSSTGTDERVETMMAPILVEDSMRPGHPSHPAKGWFLFASASTIAVALGVWALVGSPWVSRDEDERESGASIAAAVPTSGLERMTEPGDRPRSQAIDDSQGSAPVELVAAQDEVLPAQEPNPQAEHDEAIPLDAAGDVGEDEIEVFEEESVVDPNEGVLLAEPRKVVRRTVRPQSPPTEIPSSANGGGPLESTAAQTAAQPRVESLPTLAPGVDSPNPEVTTAERPADLGRAAEGPISVESHTAPLLSVTDEVAPGKQGTGATGSPGAPGGTTPAEGSGGPGLAAPTEVAGVPEGAAKAPPEGEGSAKGEGATPPVEGSPEAPSPETPSGGEGTTEGEGKGPPGAGSPDGQPPTAETTKPPDASPAEPPSEDVPSDSLLSP